MGTAPGRGPSVGRQAVTVVCRGVSKSFGGQDVLDGLDLEVPEGAVVTVLGRSGSGKTTLLRTIAGFERAEAGVVEIDGEVVDSPRRFVPPEKRRVGYVAQEGNLFPHLTVAKNVGFGLSRAERAAGKAEALLEMVGLGGMVKRYPHQLSGGQQQRVALARALAPGPRLVLLDEPFSSLDAGLRSSLRSDVMALLRAQHATAVFVTHDQEEALSVSDFVGVMTSGHLRQFAAPEDLYGRPVDRAVAQFLGEANILAGTAARGWVVTPLGAMSLAGGHESVSGPVSVLVRPEQISLHPPGATPTGRAGATGRVVHREFYGHDCVLLVDVTGANAPPGGPLRVRRPGRPPAEVGDAVAMSASGEAVAWPAK